MKKKLISSALIGLCSFWGITSCTANARQDKTNDYEIKTTDMNTEGKKLVVLFSHTGENYNVGYIEKGNTHIIADMIADAVGADRFEIVSEKGYPKESYDECIEIAKREIQQKARPAQRHKDAN